MDVKVLRCSNKIAVVEVPTISIMIDPESGRSEPCWELAVKKKGSDSIVINVPEGVVIRVGKSPKVKYYIVKHCKATRLKGVRGKVPGLGHVIFYKIPRGEYIFALRRSEAGFIEILSMKDVQKHYKNDIDG